MPHQDYSCIGSMMHVIKVGTPTHVGARRPRVITECLALGSSSRRAGHVLILRSAARGAKARGRATTARTMAVAAARQRAARGADAEVELEFEHDAGTARSEAGWKRGRRVLMEPGEGVRRRRGRGEVARRPVRRITHDGESDPE